MKRLSGRATLFAAILWTTPFACGYELRSDVVAPSNWLALSGEASSFALEEGSIRGFGTRLDFSHAFSRKWSTDLFVGTAFGNEKGISSTFTGLGGYGFYNLFSDCCDQEKTVLIDGVPVARESEKVSNVFQVGFGVNQFLLNGSRGVYSSSGLGVGMNYLFRLWNLQLKASVRSAQMVSNDNKVQGTFLGLGILFPL